jgi:tetratricopeptide (TPR) repeat protein
MAHAGKWVALLAIIGALVAAERRYQHVDATGQPVADRTTLEALAQLTPDVPEARQLARDLAAEDAEAHYRVGLERLKQGDAQGAVTPFREAVRLNGRHLQAHLQLGDALLALDKHTAAAEAYLQAISLQPELADARIGLAEAQIKSGRLDHAEATLREGLVRLPDSPELSFTLGLLLQQTGRSIEADEMLRRAASQGLEAPGRQ